MGKKNKNKKSGDSLVYTTSETGNAFFNDILLSGNEEEEISDKSSMVIRVSRDRKNRGGKEVTLVKGLDLPEEEMLVLGKLLKSKCGVGGAVKDDEIMVQGNHINKVIELLKKEGFSNVKQSGG